MTDILHAIFTCDLRNLEILLGSNGKINQKIPGTEGCTPLHLLVGVDNVEEKDNVLSYFLQLGADPNARSDDELTPVHIAAMWNNCSELEKLIQSGGNPWLTDNENKNAFDLAINNHAYEAYQLLNRYLAENKLNFRVKRPKTSTPYSKQNTLNTAMVKDNKPFSRYFSAHENFPLYFSSDEDSAESLFNLSRILKKDLTIGQNKKCDDLGKLSSNKGILSDICSNNYYSDCSLVSRKRSCDTGFASAVPSMKSSPNYSEDLKDQPHTPELDFNKVCDEEAPDEVDCNAGFLSIPFTNISTSGCGDVPIDKSCNSEFSYVVGPGKSTNEISKLSRERSSNSKFFSVCENDPIDSDGKVPTDKTSNSGLSGIYSDKYFSIRNEMSREQTRNTEFFSSVTDKYLSVINEGDNDKSFTSEFLLSSDETEIYSTSENEYVIPEKNINEHTETILETDDQSGIVLVERSASPVDLSSIKSCNMSDCDNYAPYDWKSCYSQSTICLSDSSCQSHSSSVFVPPDYRKLSNVAIYSQLKDLGDNPGPISNSTRETYLRRLTKLKGGCKDSCALPKPKYCSEVYTFLDGKSNGDRVQNLMASMSAQFNSQNPNQKWREGNQRNCFNYFLLDPRVTQNLPARMKQLTFEKAFLTFMDALFYVGKGMRSRPYSHLLEAAKVASNSQWKNDKVAHILDIWESGNGVISLHCFNNCIPVEAYTQEACIIDAVGLENLTNIKNGNYYGVATKWKWSWKRQVGVELLHRALQIFILEGEKQIFPKDIRAK